MAFARKPGSVPERFWAKVATGAPDDCWPWLGSTSSGYGKFMVGRSADGAWRPKGAHVVAWELTKAAVPQGMFVCHRCDNRICVNPAHLFLGTPADNQRDMARKNRSVFGERAPHAVLSDEKVGEIFRLRDEGVNRAEIARRIGAKYGTVRGVLEGRTWRRLHA